jgi:hypothetical protein
VPKAIMADVFRGVRIEPGLPDFSWSKRTKMGKIYQNDHCT